MVLLLFEQIVQLFLCVILGWFLVQLRLLKPTDSRVLSVVCLYLIIPCVIITALPDRADAGAAPRSGPLPGNGHRHPRPVLHRHRPAAPSPAPDAGGAGVPDLYQRRQPDHPPGDRGPGARVGHLLQHVPAGAAVPLWSHGRILLSGERKISLRKILLNVNILSVFTGVLLFALDISIPHVIEGTMESLGSMVGPLSMIVAGMLMGDQDLLAVLRIRSIWKVAILRLLVLPLAVLCILKYSGLAALVPNGASILLISLLAASAPAASNVTQIAQVYGHEGDYASAINVITTLLCIGTMPLMVLLYQL